MLKEFVSKKPVIFSILVMIFSIGITFIPLDAFLFQDLNRQAAEYASGMVEQTFVSMLLILLLMKLQLLEAAGIHGRIRQLWLVWPMLLIAFLDALELLDGTVRIDMSHKMTVILYILVYLTTGLFEEILCRGLIQTVFLQKWGHTKKGIYFSVILSSLLFGMCHLIHFFLGHATLLASVTQVIYATFIGVFMSACMLRNESIIPIIIVHGIVDITGDLNEIAIGGGINRGLMTITLSSAVESVIIMLPLLLYGLFILRKCTCREFMESADC